MNRERLGNIGKFVKEITKATFNPNNKIQMGTELVEYDWQNLPRKDVRFVKLFSASPALLTIALSSLVLTQDHDIPNIATSLVFMGMGLGFSRFFYVRFREGIKKQYESVLHSANSNQSPKT